MRQLDAGRHVARVLRGANEALGARVAELESGTVLKTALSKLAERDEVFYACVCVRRARTGEACCDRAVIPR